MAHLTLLTDSMDVLCSLLEGCFYSILNIFHHSAIDLVNDGKLMTNVKQNLDLALQIVFWL